MNTIYRSLTTSTAMLAIVVVLGCSRKPVPNSKEPSPEVSSSAANSNGSEELLTVIRESSRLSGMPLDTLADKRAFLTAGRDMVTRAHEILNDKHKCRKMETSGFALEQPRALMRLFYLGADVATADSQPKDAAELCLDLTRLGTVIANSTGLEGYDMGIACHIIAVEKLEPLCNVLDTATCNRLIDTLDREFARLDSAETAEQRGSVLAASAGQGRGDSDAQLTGKTLLEQQAQRRRMREKICRTLGQLCRVKLALRVYYLREGRFPQSLQDLERSKILDRLPKDYWRADGFVFRLRDSDYLLYSVGPDQRDDNGKQLGIDDLLQGASGDLMLWGGIM